MGAFTDFATMGITALPYRARKAKAKTGRLPGTILVLQCRVCKLDAADHKTARLCDGLLATASPHHKRRFVQAALWEFWLEAIAYPGLNPPSVVSREADAKEWGAKHPTFLQNIGVIEDI